MTERKQLSPGLGGRPRGDSRKGGASSRGCCVESARKLTRAHLCVFGFKNPRKFWAGRGQVPFYLTSSGPKLPARGALGGDRNREEGQAPAAHPGPGVVCLELKRGDRLPFLNLCAAAAPRTRGPGVRWLTAPGLCRTQVVGSSLSAAFTVGRRERLATWWEGHSPKLIHRSDHERFR